MRNVLAVFVTCLLSLTLSQSAFAQQPTRVADVTTSIDDLLKAVRADLQEKRSDILAKNLTLSAEQAAKFWPLYERYQKEQDAIMDQQLRGVQAYIENFDQLSDAAALSLIEAHISRDGEMSALRKKWLPEFQKVLPVKVAARMMQIDRRLSLIYQLDMTMKIPLVH